MKKLKNVWTKIVQFVKNLYSEVDTIADKYCPIAIEVVEFVKTINDGFVGDAVEAIVTTVIKGNADDILVQKGRAKLREALPKVLAALQITNAISKEKDVNKQLISICSAINMSSDETKNACYHTFCTLILTNLSDGKLSWSESVQLAEYYYKNIYKK